jgi:TRAP-type C4-dicarboxylate transport system substrate-binding protein
MTIRHGGIEGNEGKMLLSLASDTVQAAVLTSFGLSEIHPSIMTVSAPFMIRNEAELAAVMREIERDLETSLNSGNFFMLAWSKSGFVNVFSRDPVFTPDDLRRQRIASNAEAAELNAVFKSMGFPIVDSDWTDLGTKLNAGVITAAYNNPAAIAAFQLHTMMRNMLSTNIAPVIGGIVINQVTWRKIGALNPNYQQQLLTATRRIATEFDGSLQNTVHDAITAMERGGLRVNRPSAAQERVWFDEMERTVPTLLGSVFDRNLYNRINDVLIRHRGGR